MSNLNHKAYLIGGVSHTGSSHIRKHQINQDSIGLFQGDDYYILSVADGHGSQMHFRSDRGSKFAVLASEKVLKSFAENKPLSTLSKSLESIKKKIYDHWLMLCFEDMKQDPIEVLKTTKEYHVLNGEHTLESTGENIVMYQDKRIPLSDSEAKYVLKNPITAYGSTLLSALIMHEGIVLFQLGDGDMKLYYQKEPLDFIIPSEHMYGNSTYSLSSHDAVNHMQTVYLDTLPDFIMLTTDGIMNSFEDRNDYQKLGFEMIKSFHDDEDMFDQELSSLIKRFAEFGSGDDCSIVYAILKKEKKEV